MRSNIILTDEAIEFFGGAVIGYREKKVYDKPISSFGNLDENEPMEFAYYEDPEDSDQEKAFLGLLKLLPNDKLRVVALLLFLRKELGWKLSYNDFSKIWNLKTNTSFSLWVVKMREIVKANKEKAI